MLGSLEEIMRLTEKQSTLPYKATDSSNLSSYSANYRNKMNNLNVNKTIGSSALEEEREKMSGILEALQNRVSRAIGSVQTIPSPKNDFNPFQRADLDKSPRYVSRLHLNSTKVVDKGESPDSGKLPADSCLINFPCASPSISGSSSSNNCATNNNIVSILERIPSYEKPQLVSSRSQKKLPKLGQGLSEISTNNPSNSNADGCSEETKCLRKSKGTDSQSALSDLNQNHQKQNLVSSFSSRLGVSVNGTSNFVSDVFTDDSASEKLEGKKIIGEDLLRQNSDRAHSLFLALTNSVKYGNSIGASNEEDIASTNTNEEKEKTSKKNSEDIDNSVFETNESYFYERDDSLEITYDGVRHEDGDEKQYFSPLQHSDVYSNNEQLEKLGRTQDTFDSNFSVSDQYKAQSRKILRVDNIKKEHDYKLYELQQEASDLRLQLEETLQDLELSTQTINLRNREIDENIKRIHKMESEKQNLMCELDTSSVKIMNLEKENKELNQHIEFMENASIELQEVHDASCEARKLLANEIGQLHKIQEDSNQKISAAQNMIASLELQVKNLTIEAEELHEQLKLTKDEKISAESMFERLQSQLETILGKFELAISQRDAANDRSKQLEKEISIIKQQQVDNIEPHNDDMMHLEEENLELRGQIHSLTHELDKARCAHAAAERAYRKAEQAHANQREFPATDARRGDKYLSTPSSYEFNETKIDDLMCQNDILLQKLEEMESKHLHELTHVQETLSHLTKQLEMSNAEAKSQAAAVESSHGQIEELECELERRQRRLDAAVKDRKQSSSGLLKIQTNFDELKLKYDSVCKKLAESQNSKALARFANNEVQKLTSANKELQKRIDKSELERDHLQVLVKNSFTTGNSNNCHSMMNLRPSSADSLTLNRVSSVNMSPRIHSLTRKMHALSMSPTYHSIGQPTSHQSLLNTPRNGSTPSHSAAFTPLSRHITSRPASAACLHNKNFENEFLVNDKKISPPSNLVAHIYHEDRDLFENEKEIRNEKKNKSIKIISMPSKAHQHVVSAMNQSTMMNLVSGMETDLESNPSSTPSLSHKIPRQRSQSLQKQNTFATTANSQRTTTTITSSKPSKISSSTSGSSQDPGKSNLSNQNTITSYSKAAIPSAAGTSLRPTSTSHLHTVSQNLDSMVTENSSLPEIASATTVATNARDGKVRPSTSTASSSSVKTTAGGYDTSDPLLMAFERRKSTRARSALKLLEGS